VKIAETRPIAKAVAFCIVQDLGDARQKVRGEEPLHPKPPAEAPAE
jgi:hypothetical protein